MVTQWPAQRTSVDTFSQCCCVVAVDLAETEGARVRAAALYQAFIVPRSARVLLGWLLLISAPSAWRVQGCRCRSK